MFKKIERIEFLKELVHLINESNKIAVLTHTSADGDALGSCLAMGLAMEYLGKKVSVFIEEPVPKTLDFLPGQHLISENHKEMFELAVCLDTSDLKRLGTRADIYNSAIKKINIDHHTTNTIEADGIWINQKASATGEMVYYLVKALDVPMNRDIAIGLYTAIVTDTGGFRYSNTNQESHLISAELLTYGIPFANIAKKVFDIVSHSKLYLLKKAMQNLTLYYNGKVAVSWLDNKDITPVNAQSDDFEGLVNIGRNLEGVEVSLFLREEQPGHFKGSLRANEYVDVAKISSIFSGGGHKLAAGFSIDGMLDEIIQKVIAEIQKEL